MVSTQEISRKEREYLTRRSEIMRAAEKLFGDRGFVGATMADLAAASEFSIGSLYKLFTSKEEVFYSLALEKMDIFDKKLEDQIRRHPPGIGQIKVLIESSLAFFEENRDFFKIMITERAALESGNGNSRSKLKGKQMRTVLIFRRAIEQAIEEGEIEKLNSLDLTCALEGLLRSFVHRWAFNPGSPEPILRASFIYDLFLHGAGKRGRKA